MARLLEDALELVNEKLRQGVTRAGPTDHEGLAVLDQLDRLAN
jgi:hypothetical protein